MAYGFSAINTSSQVQIDNNYANYYMIASGTSNTVQPTGGGGYVAQINSSAATITFSNPNNDEYLVAVRVKPASFTASISGTTMTVSALDADSGKILPGMQLQGVGGTGLTFHTYVVSGPTAGGTGTYTISPSQTVSSRTITSAPYDTTTVDTYSTFTFKKISSTSFAIAHIWAEYTYSAFDIYHAIIATSFDWRVYVPMSSLSSGTTNTGYGLNVYLSDNSGNVSFSSSKTKEMMRPIGLYDAPGFVDINNGGMMFYNSALPNCRETYIDAQGTQTKYPFVTVNGTAGGTAVEADIGEYYNISVGSKTKSNGNRYVISKYGVTGFDNFSGDPYTNGFRLTIYGLYSSFSYNTSTGVLTATRSGTANALDFPAGMPFCITTGSDSNGWFVSNPLKVLSTSVSGSTASVQIGTGVTIDPLNPSATSWSGQRNWMLCAPITVPNRLGGTVRSAYYTIPVMAVYD